MKIPFKYRGILQVIFKQEYPISIHEGINKSYENILNAFDKVSKDTNEYMEQCRKAKLINKRDIIKEGYEEEVNGKLEEFYLSNVEVDFDIKLLKKILTIRTKLFKDIMSDKQPISRQTYASYIDNKAFENEFNILKEIIKLNSK